LNLYKLARNVNTAEVILSGNPQRQRRRATNILKGRLLARSGFFAWLWR